MSDTELNVLTVRWKDRWFRDSLFFVEVGKEKRKYPVAGSLMPAASAVQLRANGAGKRFNEFLAASGLAAELANSCALGEPVAVLYDLGRGPWNFPWELALTNLVTERARAAYIPVRIVNALAPFRPFKHSQALRVLILEGFPGEIPNRIRPDLEASGIVEAWNGLDPQVRARIEPPKRFPFHPTSLAGLLASEQPHILWYCGHGRSSPSPGLLYDHDAWMSVRDFAAAVPKNSPPLCATLWACELGEPGLDLEATAPAPEIHSALADRGVRATLAVQSRINDGVARFMAAELFNGLAISLSLERAAARARRVAFALPTARLDWASPAVWLAQAPRTSWEWATAPSSPILERLIASLTVKQSQKTVEIDPRSSEAIETARSWGERKRVVVGCDLGSEAVKIELARIADAAFHETNRIPVFISMEKTSPIASITDWAKEILSWCEAEMFPSSLGMAIRFAAEDPYSAPRRLLGLEDCMLVFINPPTDQDAEWFMNALASSRREAPIVLITDTPTTDARFENWAKDTLMTAENRGQLEAQLRENASSLTAMAVLDLPMPESALAAIGFSRQAFPRGTPILFETRTGPILPEWAKRMVLERITPEQNTRAHEVCLEMLRKYQVSTSDRLRREILRHLVGAGHEAEALKEAALAIEANYLEDRFAATVECFELLKPLGRVRRSLDTLALLRVAEAYARVGKPDRTRLYLQDCHPENPLQQSVVFALQSEIEKNDGTQGWRERAINFASRAIDAAKEALAAPELKAIASAQLMDYRMNAARLEQYLNYDAAAAAAAYRELLDDLNGTRGRDTLVAAIERNLSECLLSGHEEETVARQEAQALLDDADGRLPERHQLRADVAYMRAKLAESEGLEPYEALLETCARVARNNGNGMVEAIADARIFWTRDHFDLNRWREIEMALAPYRHHGWAVRTAMNGRIRAARVLAAQGKQDDALALLRLNARAIEDRPAFDRGSDRDRIAYTLGGIMVLDPKDPDKSRVVAIEWLQGWLESKHVHSLEEAWNKG